MQAYQTGVFVSTIYAELDKGFRTLLDKADIICHQNNVATLKEVSLKTLIQNPLACPHIQKQKG